MVPATTTTVRGVEGLVVLGTLSAANLGCRFEGFLSVAMDPEMKERPYEVITGDVGHSSSVAGRSSAGLVTQEDLEKIWALDKAPPPIKTHPEGEDSETSSHELSPPPSPKRKKDLLEKDNPISRPFSPIAALRQDSA